MENKCVLPHLNWINHGHRIPAITSLRKKVSIATGEQAPTSAKKIAFRGVTEDSNPKTGRPIADLTYLFVDSYEFSDNCSFCGPARFFQALKPLGCDEIGSTEGRSPMSKLQSLKTHSVAFRIGKRAFTGSFTPSDDRITLRVEPIARQKGPLIHFSPEMLRRILKRCRAIGKIFGVQELDAGEFTFSCDQSTGKLSGHFKFRSREHSEDLLCYPALRKI